MRLVHNARLAGAALALMAIAACGDSNDPAPFDPAGTSGDLAAAELAIMGAFDSDAGEQFALVGDFMSDLTGGGPVLVASQQLVRASFGGTDSSAARAQLTIVAKSLMKSRAPISGSAIILPAEVLGTTYVWSDVEDTYVASDRTDAPDNGVRFAIYALDPVTHEPAAPLNELGYIDLLDLSTASADVARIIVVSQDVTYFDYRVSLSGTENDADVDVLGFVTDGEHRVNFDLQNHFSFTEVSEEMGLDYELEFPNIDVTMAYNLAFSGNASGNTVELDASLRGPHGYVDLTGTESSSEAGTTIDFLFEVNGDDFAVVNCTPDSECLITDPQGNPLTTEEELALERFYGFSEAGFFLSLMLMTPAGGFMPL